MSTTFAETTELELVVLPVAISDDEEDPDKEDPDDMMEPGEEDLVDPDVDPDADPDAEEED